MRIMRIRELCRHDDEAPDFWWTQSGSTYDVRHADPVDYDVEGALSLFSCAACLASRFRDEPLACL